MFQGENWYHTVSPSILRYHWVSEGISQCLGVLKQKTNSDRTFLITTDHILEVQVLSRKCPNCTLIIQAETLPIGLINIGDLLLVSLDVFYSIENLVQRGLPPETAVNSVFADITSRACSELGNNDWVEKYIYHGFYSFKALQSERDEDTICAICGTAPDVLLGDGTEDISCKVNKISFID